jgi:galactose mutarotase-like enzyme
VIAPRQVLESARISAGDLDAAFVPAAGMAGVSLRHRGVELLDLREGLGRYVEDGAVMGIPLLYPWANRLDDFGFAFDGRRVHLPHEAPVVHCDEHGLPIHGLLSGTSHWRLLLRSPDRLVAGLDLAVHPELLAAFPFQHTVTLDIRLDPAGLEIATTVRATGSAPVPIAFGFHPYLRLPGVDRREWEITLPERRHLELDHRAIPTGRGTLEPATTFALGGRAFDDGYDDVSDGARFAARAPGRSVAVTLVDGYPAAQLFSPAGAQFICFEPMTAPTNALRSGRGLRVVLPGDAFTAVFRIDVGA